MSSLHGLFRLAVLPILALLLLQQKAFPLINSPQIQPYVSWLPVSLQNAILDNRPRITFPQGTVVGITVRDTLKHPVDTFRGIRYALPPIGDRRFRRAEPMGPSEDVIEATRFGPRYEAESFINLRHSINGTDVLVSNCYRSKATTETVRIA
ncbi:hypothetical protein BDV36DRAFT_226932 [Aspergillus pseudocaelatus]|uniref:Carboxylesterase type B domain-containing protein n=1 Tax=Aspergillus pseudocaelatus TaxID=1825620 RepID=A0ABQ6WDJ7_9EURO|nr:hypothetical protein BDV36DRAFT_226932 [Aspergillus pseudocaelatus]